MIRNDEQLIEAQNAVFSLEKILVEARKVHSAEEYRAMSEPLLLEIQKREQDILEYLSKTKAEILVG